MYRCDACGVTGDRQEAFQAVSFPSEDAHCPTWHACTDTTACFLSLWGRRLEVSSVKSMFDSLLSSWGPVRVGAQDDPDVAR